MRHSNIIYCTKSLDILWRIVYPAWGLSTVFNFALTYFFYFLYDKNVDDFIHIPTYMYLCNGAKKILPHIFVCWLILLTNKAGSGGSGWAALSVSLDAGSVAQERARRWAPKESVFLKEMEQGHCVQFHCREHVSITLFVIKRKKNGYNHFNSDQP